MNTERRFLSHVRVVPAGGCWIWIGQTNKGEYGGFHMGSRTDGTRRTVRAHRWAYEHWREPIPDGLEPDHLCRIHRCVNPWHMQPVTHRENMRRGCAPLPPRTADGRRWRAVDKSEEFGR